MANRMGVHIILNALFFQACWFLSIFEHWLWASFFLILLIANTLLQDVSIKTYAKLIAIAVFGILVDSVLRQFEIFRFSLDATYFSATLVPNWLVILWFGFVLTLPSSLRWLFKSWYMPAFVFAIAGPASYFAGRRFGAIDFDNLALVVISVFWLLIGVASYFLLYHSANQAQQQGRYV